MKIYYFLITFFLHTSITHANSNEMLISHDRIIYSPLDHLGKSISFDLQIEGTEQVNKMESYGKVDNLIFNVLVKRGNIKEIQISGLKGKFRDLENNLKAKVLPYLELIFQLLCHVFTVDMNYQEKVEKLVLWINLIESK